MVMIRMHNDMPVLHGSFTGAKALNELVFRLTREYIAAICRQYVAISS